MGTKKKNPGSKARVSGPSLLQGSDLNRDTNEGIRIHSSQSGGPESPAGGDSARDTHIGTRGPKPSGQLRFPVSGSVPHPGYARAVVVATTPRSKPKSYIATNCGSCKFGMSQ